MVGQKFLWLEISKIRWSASTPAVKESAIDKELIYIMMNDFVSTRLSQNYSIKSQWGPHT